MIFAETSDYTFGVINSEDDNLESKLKIIISQSI